VQFSLRHGVFLCRPDWLQILRLKGSSCVSFWSSQLYRSLASSFHNLNGALLGSLFPVSKRMPHIEQQESHYVFSNESIPSFSHPMSMQTELSSPF
jgi:hypothetical protein